MESMRGMVNRTDSGPHGVLCRGVKVFQQQDQGAHCVEQQAAG